MTIAFWHWLMSYACMLYTPTHTIPNKSHLGEGLGAFPNRGNHHLLSHWNKDCVWSDLFLICGGQESSAGPSSPTLMQKRVKHQIWWNIKSPRWLSTPYSPDLDSCDFWLFPKLKSPLKGKRFQTIDEIQQNTRGKLMEIGRIVWGPKAPTLKGTEASLSYAQCFLYLVSSAINVSIFHITWLDRFWTDQIMLC